MFDAAIAQLNSSVLVQLADSTVRVNGGDPIAVRWDREFEVSQSVQNRRARFTGAATDFANLAKNDLVVVQANANHAEFTGKVHQIEREDHGLIQVDLRSENYRNDG